MDTKSGEIFEFEGNNKEMEVAMKLKEAEIESKITKLTAYEHDAIKDIKMDKRPIELAWSRFKKHMDASETSLRTAFEEGFKAKEKWLG